MTVREKLLRKVIIEEYPNLAEHVVSPVNVRNVMKHWDPFTYLYLNDTEGFISHIKSTRQFDRDNGEYTYLQYACIAGLTNVVQMLFDCGVDPNKTLRRCDNLPIFFAAYRGFADIIELFLARSSFFFNGKRCKMIYQTARTTVLHQVILGLNENTNVNNASCDHYKSFKMLLQFSKYNPLSLDINRVDHLGHTCLHLAGQRNMSNYIFSLLDYGAFIGKRDVKGITSLSTISDSTLESYLNKCVKHNDVPPKDDKYEIIFSYKFLCPPKVFPMNYNKKNEHRLESQKFDYEDIPETDVLLSISEVPELRGLLLHPLLTSFLYLKWMKIRMFYYFNLLIYLGFLFILYFYIYYNIEKNKQFPEESIFRTLLWIYLIFFTAREIFHYISSREIYIKSLESWIEIIVIVLTFCLLYKNLDDPLTISSILILISWTELTFIIGQGPRMAVQVEMFKVVSKNVLKTLLWYSVILFAFIQSFYIMFSNDDKFSNFSLATFKLIIMLTGEFDSSSLPFQSNPIVSRLLFVLFIFLIPVVLVNLLNGLAVSDIQAIKNDAEIIAQVSRIKFINFYETIAVKNMFLRIRKSKNCIINYGCQIFSVFIYLFGAINLKLFQDDREDFEISVFTNEDNVIVVGSVSNQIRRNTRFRWKNLDTEIVKKAMKLFETSSENSS